MREHSRLRTYLLHTEQGPLIAAIEAKQKERAKAKRMRVYKSAVATNNYEVLGAAALKAS